MGRFLDKGSIGGYFSWEFPPMKEFTLHENAVFVNSCRHALEYVLKNIKYVSKIYIPYYTCDAVLEIIRKIGISYSFYIINENLEIGDFVVLKDNEYILYTNYFGIKDLYVKEIAEHYGSHVIIDNAQALYCPPIAEYQIYSPRKFMGIPDGGLAITSIEKNNFMLPKSFSFDKCKHLLKRIELDPSEGYQNFKDVSRAISSEPLSQMSDISYCILHSVDFDVIKNVRIHNFERLHNALGSINMFSVPNINTFSCPMIYPFRTSNLKLRERLINNQIFVATYWPNVLKWCISEKQLEYILVNEIIPLPIDQRYNDKDMDRIINTIKEN